jgi:nitroreductase
MAFLSSRRSRPARTLTLPVPTRDQLLPILTAAVRVPDHGKLEPWRLIVLEKPALMRLALLAEERGQALGLVADALAKGVAQFTDSNLAIAVVKCPRSTEKIAEIEQVLSVGAVCISLLNAALAAGWGANWLTGWAVEDQAFREVGLGLLPGEWVAGLIHVGTEGTVPPERPRPDLGSVVTWVNA